jgi:hypothetical protein
VDRAAETAATINSGMARLTEIKNMNETITKQTERQVARPLNVLPPIIKADYEEMQALTHEDRVKIGGELWEARSHYNYSGYLLNGEIGPPLWKTWLKKSEFPFNDATAREWMAMFRTENPEQWIPEEKGATDQRDVQSTHAHRESRKKPETRKKEKSRQQERQRLAKLARKLAVQLVTEGFRVMSMKHHPDKGGTHDSMRLLYGIRKALQNAIKTGRIALIHE